MSCERLRALLPQFDGRREDMASVLEMAVQFLRLTHALVPGWEQNAVSCGVWSWSGPAAWPVKGGPAPSPQPGLAAASAGHSVQTVPVVTLPLGGDHFPSPVEWLVAHAEASVGEDQGSSCCPGRASHRPSPCPFALREGMGL